MKSLTIKELCTVVRGSSPRPKGDPRYYGGKVPRLMVSDVSRDGMYVTPKIDFLTEEGAKKSRPMLKGDLVIAVSGNPGEPTILNIDACIHDGFVGLRNLDQSLVFTPYLYRYFKYNKLKSQSQAVGAIYKNLNTNQIKALKIPLPPLTQQKKIAAILDAADDYRQKTKALIAKYEELTQSLFLDMFGDPVTNPKDMPFPKLKEVCKVSQGMQIAIKNRFAEPGPNRYTYLTVAYLNGRKDAQYIENPRLSVVCDKDDVLMTRTGNTGQVVHNVEGVFHNNFFKVDWDRSIIEKEYFVAFLSHFKIKQELLKRASTTTIPDLNHGQFYDLNIIIPSNENQKKFVSAIQAIESQKSQAQASLAKAEDLFNCLLQKAFKGELS